MIDQSSKKIAEELKLGLEEVLRKKDSRSKELGKKKMTNTGPIMKLLESWLIKPEKKKKTKEEEDKEAKAYKKKSMKEMMAAAKIAKEQGRGAETGQFSVKEINAANGEYMWEPNDLQKQTDFYNGVKEKAQERFKQKQEGVPHSEGIGADVHKPQTDYHIKTS
jgi:hypothetical protein